MPRGVLQRLSVLIGLGAVLLIALLVHASYIPNGFTWLDHGDIERGRAVLELGQLPSAFVTRFGETGFYRPLVTVAHSIDAAIFGSWAPGYHMTNVALHLAVCVAAFLFAGAFFGLAPRERVFAALIVGIHPLSWLPVGAISYRPELLAALFTLLAVSLYIEARGSGSTRLGLLAVGSFALGLSSKETVLVWVPALVLAWEWMRGPGRDVDDRVAWRRPPVWLLLGLAVVVGLYIALRLKAVPELWRVSAPGLPFSQWVGTRLAVLGESFVQLVYPLKPGLSDATRVRSLVGVPALATMLGVIGSVAIVWRLGRRSPWTMVIVFLGIALAPALNIVPLARFSSPHYAYFGVVGVGAALVLAFRHVRERSPSVRRVATAVLAAWLLTMAGATFAAGFRFRNDVTLFAPEVESDPHFREGHQYLGDHFFHMEDYERARREYQAALEDRPGIIAYVDRHAVLINLAGVYLARNRLGEADELLRRAAADAPHNSLPHILYNRALIASRRGDPGAVVELLGDRNIDWTRPAPLLLLARALRRLDRDAEAAAALRRALPLLSEDQRRQVQELIRQLRQ